MDVGPWNIKTFYTAELSAITRSSRTVRVHVFPSNPCSVEITLDYNLLKCSLLSRERMDRKTVLAANVLLYTFPWKSYQYVNILRLAIQEISDLLWNPNFLLPCLQTHINWLYPTPDKSTYNLPRTLLNGRLNIIFEPSLRMLRGLFPLG
jgi:hypothetical protein